MLLFHRYQHMLIISCALLFIHTAKTAKMIEQGSRPHSLIAPALPSLGMGFLQQARAQELRKEAEKAPLLLKNKAQEEAYYAEEQAKTTSSTYQKQLEQMRIAREKAETEAAQAKRAQEKAEAEATQAKRAQEKAEAEAEAKIAQAEAEQARKELEKAEAAAEAQAKAVIEAQKPAYKSMPPGPEREQAKKAYLESLSPEAKVIFSQKETLEEETAKRKRDKFKDEIKSAAGGGALGLGGTSAAALVGAIGLEAAGVTNFIPDDDAPASSSGQPGQNIAITIGDTTVGSSGTTTTSSTGASSSDVIALIDE
jgi:hypothetical protein